MATTQNSRRYSSKSILVVLGVLMVATFAYMAVCLRSPYPNSVADIQAFRNRLGPVMVAFHRSEGAEVGNLSLDEFNHGLSQHLDIPGFSLQPTGAGYSLVFHKQVNLNGVPIFMAHYRGEGRSTLTIAITTFAKRHFPRIERKMVQGRVVHGQLMFPLSIEQVHHEIIADPPGVERSAGTDRQWMRLAATHFHNDFVLFALGEKQSHEELMQAAIALSSIGRIGDLSPNVF